MDAAAIEFVDFTVTKSHLYIPVCVYLGQLCKYICIHIY